MVGAKQKAAEDTAANQAPKLEDRADQQRAGERNGDNPRQVVGSAALAADKA